MTGFAAVRVSTSAGELNVSLRSVNHRGLDLHFHGAAEFAPFENELRALLKQHIVRGHIEIRLSLDRPPAGTRLTLNRAALASYLAAFHEVAAELGRAAEPDLNALLSLPGVMDESAAATGALDDSFVPQLIAAFRECIGVFNRHREREGGALAGEMMRQAGFIRQSIAEIAELRSTILPILQARLHERLAELFSGVEISEKRLLEEAALLADRSDIHEEIVRLDVHTAELQKLLASGGTVGKSIDFLVQEMNREANTTLAKSANAGEAGLRITALGLELKATIERIREQALNLE